MIYTRRQLLQIIESHGGPAGLDLSDSDLSGIDLSSDAIQAEMGLVGASYENPPSWYSSETRGINLSGIVLQRACLQGAYLWRGNFHRADMGGVQLQRADLGNSVLVETNLSEANLQGAVLSRSNLTGADLTRANLAGSYLQEIDLSAVKSLDGIYLCGANLSRATIRREQLRGGVGEEREQDYYGAKEAYLALKNNFLSLGRYDDASWAYRKERRMERAMSWPGRAAHEHKEDKEQLEKDHPQSWKARFYTRHTVKWLLDGAVELVTDYGESPARVVLWSLFILTLFTLLYGTVGVVGPIDLARAQTIRVFDPGAVLTYSLAALGTVGLESLRPLDRVTEVLTAIEGILGISLLALLMFTLGNRISRS